MRLIFANILNKCYLYMNARNCFLISAAMMSAALLGACTGKSLSTDGTVTGGQAVDLGLNVEWAAWNIGAESPEDAGYYFAWGETSEKADYSQETYMYYDPEGYWDQITIGPGILGGQYDAASVLWGEGWRMPAEEEIVQLINKCKWETVEYKGIIGEKVTGPNGNSIFFPAAGVRKGTGLEGYGSSGAYWVGERPAGRSSAYYLGMQDGDPQWSITRACWDGCTIRAVRSKRGR